MRVVKKLIVASLVSGVVLTGCANAGGITSDDKLVKLNEKYVSNINNAVKKLTSTYSDYIISNTLEAPNETVYYLDISHGKDTYTEYPVDSKGKVGGIQYGSKKQITYTLTDWYSSGGKYYIFGSDSSKKSKVYTLPSAYNKYVKDRGALYVNDMLKGATSIRKLDNMTVTIPAGKLKLKSYMLEVKADTVKKVLGLTNYDMYASIKEDKSSSANLKKLANFYMMDSERTLTCSDAYVTVGIDDEGVLRYVNIDVGGLGNHLSLTKVVAGLTNDNVRSMPDVSKATAYSDNLKDLADFVSQYDDYYDAVKAINEKYSSSTSNSVGSSSSKKSK